VPEVSTVVVVGTGVMAPGIAAACAAAGCRVVIAGRSRPHAEAAAGAAGEGVTAAVISETAVHGCDLVIESVVEDLEVKRALYAAVEPWLSDSTILASNTSSLPMADLAEGLDHPERFAALHFLNPADSTAVVEIVRGAETSEATVAALVELATRMGKLPLVLQRDVPGFIWNRLQMAVLRECLYLLDEGIADVEAIDAAVSDGLAPRWLAAGPLGTSDLGGPATFRIVAEQLFPRLSTATGPSARLGSGFYAWSEPATAGVRAVRAEGLALGRARAGRPRQVQPPAAE
jgi:3-hydroxybutyryl-CoA dehydrogenase